MGNHYSGVAINIAGRRFGLLTVVTRVTTTLDAKRRWVCECDCGVRKTVRYEDLVGRNGHKAVVRTCGSVACKEKWRAIQHRRVAAGIRIAIERVRSEGRVPKRRTDRQRDRGSGEVPG